MKKIVFGWIVLVAPLFAKVSFVHRSHPFATHQPVLYEMAKRTNGPIIEFGCGNGSTPILHELCKATKRTLISIDDDWKWIKKFMNRYRGDGFEEDNSGWHQFYFVPGKPDIAEDVYALHWIEFLETFPLFKSMHFDLAFVDQSPGQARTETIQRIKDQVRFIVLHDCDCYVSGQLGVCYRDIDGENEVPGIFDFSQTFTHFKTFFPLHPWPACSGPPTLLGSNFEEVPDIDYENY